MRETAETIYGSSGRLAAISLVLVVGALLRLHGLGGESLDGDELASWLQAKDSILDMIKRTAHDNYPPLHNLALFAAIKFFGNSGWGLRLPSVIFGTANIAVLYWLGTMTVGRIAGLIAAALLALSPLHIWFSQEARMYTLLALAATLYSATSFHYLRAPSFPRAVWVSLAGLALVYSHPYGTLDWVSIAAAFGICVLPPISAEPRTVRVWTSSNIVIGVGFVPWALILAHRAHLLAVNGFWIPAPFSPGIFNDLLKFVGGPLLAGIVLIGVVLGVIGRLRGDVAVLCTWIFAPPLTGILASILSTPIFFGRYVIGSLPPLLLLSAFGWTRYGKGSHIAILSPAILAISGLALLQYNDPYPKEDLRGVGSFLAAREQPTDCVLTSPADYVERLHFYGRNPACHWGTDKLADLPAEMPASVLFGVFYTPRTARFVDELRRRGWRDLDRAAFRDVQVVIFVR
jgi:4-amino-4-deoxy-L-arabinose transferase-like glycosyltransferase